MRRDRLVTFLGDAGGAANALNEPAQDFQPIGDAYAAREDLDMAEARAAGETMAIAMARFTVRENDMTRGLTADNRLRVEALDWKITRIVPSAKSRRGYLDITAVRRADG